MQKAPTLQTTHNLLKHENCTVENCAICSGAVQVCLTCNGSKTEAGGDGLTTQCFESPLTEEQKLAVAKGDLDFIKGRWYDKRLGPTLFDTLKEKEDDISIGTRKDCLNPKEGSYICIGVYKNSNGNTIYSFHQIMTYGNRAHVGFVSLIHYAKFQELFGEL